MFTEIERVDAAVAALEAGDLAAFGAHLTASHASLRDDFEVSCAELDVAVDACLAAGALGARLTGGGFGGSAIALLPGRGGRAGRGGVHRGVLEPRVGCAEVPARDGSRWGARGGLDNKGKFLVIVPRSVRNGQSVAP